MFRTFSGFFGLAALVLAWPALGAVTFSVNSNTTRLYPGDPLTVNVVATNDEQSAVELWWSSGFQTYYRIGDVIVGGVGIHIPTSVLVPGNGTYTWTRPHDWRYYPLRPGRHEVFGRVVQYRGYLETAPYMVEVLPPVAPADDILIDFDRLHDSGEPVTALTDYMRYGVNFRGWSAGRYPAPDLRRQGTMFASSDYDSSHRINYMTVGADFEMPVYGVTADVSAPAGTVVGMTAKDSAGNILAQVVSEPVPAAGTFISGLSIRSEIPIAAIEWAPVGTVTARYGYVHVDNVLVHVPEAGIATLVSVSALTLMWRRFGKGGRHMMLGGPT